ncbi:hypothetical protein C1645_834420 [Glomus cerebriforme]|uniref:Uncharacterized protein n=1 Tax=Glomus cerebriforme TaxID=658196 RepID=A0A397SE87_9GLOM|nr:hypothetical protein C1645_834420 [Glomus cerebriforme]
MVSRRMTKGEDAGYIKAWAIPNTGNWTSFSSAQIQNFIKGVCPKRLPLQKLTNELQNRKIDYGNQNKRQNSVKMLDKELTQETLKNKGSYLRNRNAAKFPLSSSWATKEVQKYGKKELSNDCSRYVEFIDFKDALRV